ncbi:MAG: ABC transporter permease [Roseivirga sp.]
MLKNYFKIALRSLVKNRAFTLINIFGLFIGLTAFLLIYAYVSFERSYDRYHQDADKIYRVVTDNVVNGVTGVRDAMSFSPMGKAMKEELPEVEQYTTSMKLFEDLVFKKGDELINESGVVAADERFLDIFSYKILQGEKDPLKEPNSLILTKKGAMRLLGTEDVVGKTVEVLGIHKGSYKVTALLDDIPGNTHYKFEVLLSFATIQDRADEDGWRGYSFYTYVKLNEGVNPLAVQEKLMTFPGRYLREGLALQFTMQPMTDIHLDSGFTYEPEPSGNSKTVNFLLIIAVFILVIAWVNYINLSTAKAMDRAREVGLRKVVGAAKWQLITQFMMESLFINIAAAILAVTAVQVFGPFCNNLLGKELIGFIWTNSSLLSLLAIITIGGTLLSGFYPSLVLSSFRPVTVLKGTLRNSRSGLLLRKSLVVFQFVSSLILIAGTAIVYMQIDFMKTRDLGVEMDHALFVKMPSYDSIDAEVNQQKYELLKSELDDMPHVIGVATASSIPGGGRSSIAGSSGGLSVIGKTQVNMATYYSIMVDEDFFPSLGVELIAGRNFTDEPNQWPYAIVNETLLKHLGFFGTPEEALDQKLRFGTESSTSIKTIIGVVRDYNRRSLKDEIEPTVYHKGYDHFSTNLVIRFSPDDLNQSLRMVEGKWSELFPEVPFEYNFMDQKFDEAYKEDQQFGSLFGVFSMLAIAIAGLGLFGLSSFIALQRSKEIGVRKVLGASVLNIVKLISRDFLGLVIIAFFLGSPLVWFIMDNWLNNYAFRIDMPVWVLPVAGVTLLFITFLTVGYQTARAARANPVETLRSE